MQKKHVSENFKKTRRFAGRDIKKIDIVIVAPIPGKSAYYQKKK